MFDVPDDTRSTLADLLETTKQARNIRDQAVSLNGRIGHIVSAFEELKRQKRILRTLTEALHAEIKVTKAEIEEVQAMRALLAAKP